MQQTTWESYFFICIFHKFKKIKILFNAKNTYFKVCAQIMKSFQFIFMFQNMACLSIKKGENELRSDWNCKLHLVNLAFPTDFQSTFSFIYNLSNTEKFSEVASVIIIFTKFFPSMGCYKSINHHRNTNSGDALSLQHT